jgi:hypothetical protein
VVGFNRIAPGTLPALTRKQLSHKGQKDHADGDCIEREKVHSIPSGCILAFFSLEWGRKKTASGQVVVALIRRRILTFNLGARP